MMMISSHHPNNFHHKNLNEVYFSILSILCSVFQGLQIFDEYMLIISIYIAIIHLSSHKDLVMCLFNQLIGQPI